MARNQEFAAGRGNNLVRRVAVTPTDPETGEKQDWMQPDHKAVFPSHVTAAELIHSGDLESHWRTPQGDHTLRPGHMEQLVHWQATPREGTREAMDDIRDTGKVKKPIEIHAHSTDYGEYTELVDGHHRLAAMYMYHPNKPIPVNWVDRTPHS
jgi:hypothetical protein